MSFSSILVWLLKAHSGSSTSLASSSLLLCWFDVRFNEEQGLKRRLAKVAFQVLPITPKILKAMYGHLDMRKNQDLALWCAFIITFYGLLRKKSVVPRAGPYNQNQVLVRRHFNIHTPTNRVQSIFIWALARPTSLVLGT